MNWGGFRKLDRVEISRLELKDEITQKEARELIDRLKEAYEEIDRLDTELGYLEDMVY